MVLINLYLILMVHCN